MISYLLDLSSLRIRQIGLLLQISGVSINLLDESLDAHVLAVEIQQLAVLCDRALLASRHPPLRSSLRIECMYNKKVVNVIVVLNLTCSDVFSVVVRGRSFVEMETPWLRAEGGMLVRNSLADLEPTEKGLNLVFTSVMNRVIILKGGLWRRLGKRKLCFAEEGKKRLARMDGVQAGKWPGVG